MSITVGYNVKLQSGLINTIQIISTDTTLSNSSGPNSGYSYIIGIDTSSASIIITLDSTPDNGRTYYVFDSTGNAGTHNITINGNSKNISGSPTLVINSGYNGVTIIYSSTSNSWFVI